MSWLLMTFPFVVSTVNFPDVLPVGVDVLIVVVVEEDTLAGRLLWKLTLLFAAVVSKPVPVMFTVVPAVLITGVKLVIVGALVLVVTMNGSALVPVPDGEVTEIGPVDAIWGTFALISFALATVNIVAVTPLNLIVF